MTPGKLYRCKQDTTVSVNKGYYHLHANSILIFISKKLCDNVGFQVYTFIYKTFTTSIIMKKSESKSWFEEL